MLADRYELADLIGAGGMARVYRATDRFLDRPVAIKLLEVAAARSADPANHARFLNEARSAASFQHPNAVAVYDAGESDGELYIVMELVTGRTLADRLADEGPVPMPEAAAIADRLLDVLTAMHARNTVHRDVKPSNVLLDRHGDVKLTDFGIAKRLDEIDEALTSAGMVIGTPQYLAPEQAVGGEIGPQTDVYLVGALLYEMLTGGRPVSPVAGSHGRSTDPRDRGAKVPAALAEVVGRALAYRPEDRFPSAAAMRAAVAEFAADADTIGGSGRGERSDRRTETAEFPAAPSAAQGDRTQLIASVDPDPTPNDGADPTPTRTTPAPRATESTPRAVESRPSEREGRSPVWIAMAGLAVLAAVLVIGLAITLTSDDGAGDGSSATEPVDGAEFLRRLRTDPEEFGERGPDVRDELDRVLAITDPERRAEAEEALRVDIFVWVADGDLDSSVGEAVQAVLDDR